MKKIKDSVKKIEPAIIQGGFSVRKPAKIKKESVIFYLSFTVERYPNEASALGAIKSILLSLGIGEEDDCTQGDNEGFCVGGLLITITAEIIGQIQAEGIAAVSIRRWP